MIKETLQQLPLSKHRQIMIAFNGEFTQVIELGNGYYIGVNLVPSEALEEIERQGVWSYGKIVRSKHHTV